MCTNFKSKWQILIFQPKFGEIAQLHAIFWFKYWGCCRELGGGWNELGGVGWSWVEVENELGGGGWSWVHGLVIPDFLYKTVAANIDKDTMTDYIPLPQLITVNVLVKKKTPNG